MRSATIGKVFGRLTVVKRVDDKGHDAAFECVCACGNTTVVRKSHLYGGRIKSCGCLKRELIVAKNTLHGHTVGGTTTPEFRAWCSMKERCFKASNPKYPDYGGRGITVYGGWVGNFQAFLGEVGLKPARNYSLDRIDVNGNYEPGNVRWATYREQRLNQRRMSDERKKQLADMPVRQRSPGEIARRKSKSPHQ